MWFSHLPGRVDDRPVVIVGPTDIGLNGHAQVELAKMGHIPCGLPDHLLVGLHHHPDTQVLEHTELAEIVKILHRQGLVPTRLRVGSRTEEIDRKRGQALGGNGLQNLLVELQGRTPSRRDIHSPDQQSLDETGVCSCVEKTHSSSCRLLILAIASAMSVTAISLPCLSGFVDSWASAMVSASLISGGASSLAAEPLGPA